LQNIQITKRPFGGLNSTTMTKPELMKDTRNKLGYTQHQMAKKLGYAGQKDISNIERGNTNMLNQTYAHLLTIRERL
jgi:transcriptional regulator with XRE-family HTH domain